MTNQNVVTATVGDHHMILDDDDFPPVRRKGRQAVETVESKAIDEYIANGARGIVVVDSLSVESSVNDVANLRAKLAKYAKRRGYQVQMRFEDRIAMADKPSYQHYVWKLVPIANA